MTDLRKAAEELIKEWDWECGEHQNKALTELIEALRQALAQPEQEPVAWINGYGFWKYKPEGLDDLTPLYTSPPKREWQGLTKEDMPVGDNPMFDTDEFALGAAWAQAKLKEKNNG